MVKKRTDFRIKIIPYLNCNNLFEDTIYIQEKTFSILKYIFTLGRNKFRWRTWSHSYMEYRFANEYKTIQEAEESIRFAIDRSRKEEILKKKKICYK